MKKLVVVTLDSFQANDIELLFTLPHTANLVQHMAVVESLRPIYPTLTYPVHASIITGRRPASHGIVHNQLPGVTRQLPDWNIMGSDWYWERRYLKGETLMDAAHDAGYRVGTVLWPVTAGDQRFFNLPEIWPIGAHDTKTVRAFFEKMASPDAMDAYYDRFLSHFDWSDNKDLTLYAVDIAIDLLKRDAVDVLFLHDIVLDHIRHVFGSTGSMKDLAMRLIDNHIGGKS